MSKNKYWVPSIEKANMIIEQISKSPNELRLIDLSNMLDINKSSLYSLLNTLETLGWVAKNSNGTYSLGSVLGFMGSIYLNQFNIFEVFSTEAKKSIKRIDEHVQLGKLVGTDVFYIGREEGSSRVRLVTDPGDRYPAYTSAIGKIQLSKYDYKDLIKLYPEGKLVKKTQYTVGNVEELWEQLQKAKVNGYVIEEQEGAEGFYCVAAPVYNHNNELVYGVSFTMTEHSWYTKKEEAKDEILKLSKILSKSNGYLG